MQIGSISAVAVIVIESPGKRQPSVFNKFTWLDPLYKVFKLGMVLLPVRLSKTGGVVAIISTKAQPYCVAKSSNKSI